MKKATYFILFFLIAGLTIFYSGCKPTFEIQSENLYNRNFNAYNSFKFFNPKNMPASNFAFSDINKKRIYDAVADELQMRNFASVQDAGLLVKIQGGTSQEIENKRPTYHNDPYYSNYNASYYWNRDPYLYDDLSKKTTMIIIDIYDAKTNKLLWQGTGSGVISDKKESVEESLRKAIADIFLEFPVESNK